MDIQRLIALNTYTSDQIKEWTGVDVETPIICVGNTLSRKLLEDNILAGKSTLIIGPQGSGKLTAVMEICNRHKLQFSLNEDGSLFEDLPYYSDQIFIVRNPKVTKLLKDYISRDLPIIILCDLAANAPTGLKPILFKPLTKTQISEYEQLKGCEMISVKSYQKPEEKEKIMVTKMIMGDSDIIPENTHRWIARNFYTNATILKLCDLASQVKNQTVYQAMMELVKQRRVIDLKYPIWVKMK